MKKYILSLIVILIFFNSHAATNLTQYAAGILPFVTTSDDLSYILLGKESPDDDYKSKDTYSDFGGKSEKKEPPEITALREFKEETGLVVFSFPSIDALINEETLKKACYSDLLVANNNLTYRMYLLPIPYEIITSDMFKKALKNRDGEKSTIALFPLVPFVETIKNFDLNSAETNYVYCETENLIKNKITEYLLRKSFIKSFAQLIEKSDLIKNALKNQPISQNAKIKIICNGIDNKTAFFTASFFCIVGIVFFCFLIYKYPFLN